MGTNMSHRDRSREQIAFDAAIDRPRGGYPVTWLEHIKPPSSPDKTSFPILALGRSHGHAQRRKVVPFGAYGTANVRMSNNP